MRTAFHPATDRQTERTIQTLEDMLRACVLKFGGSWEESQKMRAAQDQQKSYADLKRSEIEFAVGDKLRKYVSDLTHVLAAETIDMDENLSYVEVAMEILDRKVRKTRNSEIALVKVLWSNHNVEEATWETEAEIKEKYRHLFT
ncbi:uncharacterized protein LOC141619468 [Silene latifolia]|uniref:uncharacterized protein LOC141619468 n=1 Tax=Silene latifolia TaxID=37657 RepID=UPI003D7810A1